jgi:hypothetical protein
MRLPVAAAVRSAAFRRKCSAWRTPPEPAEGSIGLRSGLWGGRKNSLASAALRALVRELVRASELVGFELTEFEVPSNPGRRARAVQTSSA